MLALAAGVAQAGGASFEPGAPGLGDPYFPLDGNGGYDVKHYMLEITYDPATDVLTGKATISARAQQNLSQFNLDFVGLTVVSIRVRGSAAGDPAPLSLPPSTFAQAAATVRRAPPA